MIPYGQHYLDEDDIKAVVNVLRSDCLTQGPLVDAFEQAIASYVGSKYAVAVSSGTAALHLAAKVVGVETNTSIITSPMTFVATSNAALYLGGDPLFADIDPETINISPDCIHDHLTKNTNVKAIIPVHFAGLPCDMNSIRNISDDFSVPIIEDAAHALGTEYIDGSKVGSCKHSLMTVFSFHPVKAIAAGEGGIITTNDESTYRSLLRLRSHGINKLDDFFVLPERVFKQGSRDLWYYEMQELGFNYRITDIQCALALSQLSKLDKFISRRRVLAKQYDVEFENMRFLRPAQVVGCDFSAHHLYVLRVNYEEAGITRKKLMEELISHDIYTQIHYIPVPWHPYYRNLGFHPEDYPNSLKFYSEALSIPLYYKLTDDEQMHVVSMLKSLLA